jgi:tetratricopeptide (TPR) repeat protein
LLSIKKHFKTSSFFDDIHNLKEFAKRVSFQKEVIIERVFVHTNTHEIEYYLINNDFAPALQKIKEIEKEIQKLNLSIEPYHLINFYYLHAITLVYFGEYHKALKFINIILNDFDTVDRPQVFLRVEVLNIIVHFELKNKTLVHALATQILKKNKSYKILLPVEETIVNTVLKITGLKHSTLKDETDELKLLSEAVRLAKKSSTGSSVSLIENYDKWITAKIKRKIVADFYC